MLLILLVFLLVFFLVAWMLPDKADLSSSQPAGFAKAFDSFHLSGLGCVDMVKSMFVRRR